MHDENSMQLMAFDYNIAHNKWYCLITNMRILI